MTDQTTDRPRRRLFDQQAGAPTLLGSGGRFEGNFEVDGPMSLGGTIVGDGIVGGLLSVAKEAHWRGNVRAQAAIVAGRISGDLTVEGKLEIGRTAVLRGAISAAIIAIADGAIVEGQMTVTSAAPIVRFEEKRAGADPAAAHRS